MTFKTLHHLASGSLPDIIYYIPTHSVLTSSLFFFLECSTSGPQGWLLHLLRVSGLSQLLRDNISAHPVHFTLLFVFLHSTFHHLTFIYSFFLKRQTPLSLFFFPPFLKYYLLFNCWPPVACEILVHWLGIKPTPPALEGEVLNTGPLGKSLFIVYKYIYINKYLLYFIYMFSFH